MNINEAIKELKNAGYLVENSDNTQIPIRPTQAILALVSRNTGYLQNIEDALADKGYIVKEVLTNDRNGTIRIKTNKNLDLVGYYRSDEDTDSLFVELTDVQTV